MDGKDSFIFYLSWFKLFDKLKTLEQKEQLRCLIRDYVNDKYKDVPLDSITSGDDMVDMAFTAIANDLKNDLVKWKDTCNKRAEAGRLGGLKKAENQKLANVANANEASYANSNVANVANLPDMICPDMMCYEEDKLDKLDKLGKPKSTYEKVKDIKNHLDAEGLDYQFYKSLDYDIAPYYYTKKLDQLNCKALNDYYKNIKGDKTNEKVFFYTLDKILKSDFKPDNFIGYFYSIFETNYSNYIKQSGDEQ